MTLQVKEDVFKTQSEFVVTVTKEENAFNEIDTSSAVLNREDHMHPKRVDGRAAVKTHMTTGEYFERMLKNSANKNAALRLRQDRELEKDGWTDVPETSSVKFVQQLPVAVKDGFFTSSESRAIARAKQTFRNADLCTVRELSALSTFVTSGKFGKDPVGPEAQDEAFDNELKHYVNYLIKNRIDARHLTDDYLSNHIAEVYEYSLKLEKYGKMKDKYPKFFSSVPEAKKIQLETMAAGSKKLRSLIEKHIYMHGIDLDYDRNGKLEAVLREEDANKAVRHQRREELRTDYENDLNDFIKHALNKSYSVLATQLAGNEFINESDGLLATLGEQFGKDEEVYKLFGPQVKAALSEIKNTLLVRDELVNELKGYVEQGRKSNDIVLKKNIINTNDKILLCADHIDHYKSYLYFLKGDIAELRKETVDFLMREDHEGLLAPVKFKENIKNKQQDRNEKATKESFHNEWRNELKRREEIIKENPDLLSHVTSFEARIRDCDRKRAVYDKEITPRIKALKDENTKVFRQHASARSAGDQEKTALYEEELKRIDAEMNQLKDGYEDCLKLDGSTWSTYLSKAKEVKDFFFGLKDELSDEACVFAEENGFGAYLDKNRLDDAILRVEKSEYMKGYGYSSDMKDSTDPKVVAECKKIRRLLGIGAGDDIEKAIEDEAKLGVVMKRAYSACNNGFTDEQGEIFKNRLGLSDTVDKNEDLRCFKGLFQPVRRDIFGRAFPEYEENARENAKILDDYTFGDKNRADSVLMKMAKRILAIDLSPEKINEEYFKAHLEEMIQDFSILFKFENYYNYKLDFFMGNAFSKEEKTDLMKKMKSSSAIKARNMFSDFITKHGYDSKKGKNHYACEQNKKMASKVFTTTVGTYGPLYKVNEEAYRKALETEKRDVTDTRNEQLLLMEERRCAAVKLGRDTKVFSMVHSIAENEAFKLEEVTRQKLRARINAEEVRNNTIKRNTEGATEENVHAVMEKSPWMDQEHAGKVAGILSRITKNSERISGAFDLFDTIVSDNEKTLDLNSAEMKAKIKAFKDRIFACQFNKTTLTEEYLMEHIDELLEYRYCLRMFDRIMNMRPEIISAFSLDDLASIKFRSFAVTDVDDMLDAFLEKYSIKCSHENGKIQAAVIDERNKPSDRNVAARQKNLNDAMKRVSLASRQKGRIGDIVGRELIKTLGEEDDNERIGGGQFTHQYHDYEGIRAKLQKNRERYNNCEPYYDRVLAKYAQESRAAEQTLFDLRDSVAVVDQVREVLRVQEQYKANNDPKYDRNTFDQAKQRLRDLEEDLENSVVKTLKAYRDLDRYHELFDLAAGYGDVLSAETEQFLNTKGLTRDYGMILVNIVNEKTEEDFKEYQKKTEEEAQKAKEEEEARKAEEQKAEELVDEILDKAEEAINEEEPVGPPYHIQVERAGDFKFEQMGTNNCWCCAGTFIFNQFNAQNKKQGEETKYFNQRDLRGYVPKDFKEYKEIEKAGLSKDFSEKLYLDAINDMYGYAGLGQIEIGSVFEMADFFLEKRNDIVVNKVNIDTPYTKDNETEDDIRNDNELLDKQKTLFLKEIKKVLDTGNYVAVNRAYEEAHYFTIIGIEGDKLQCLNPSDGDAVEDWDVDFFIHKGEFMQGGVELIWFSKFTTPKDMIKKHGDKGLVFDEKTGIFSAPMKSVDEAHYVGQTKGVLVAEDDGQVKQVRRATYIPKHI